MIKVISNPIYKKDETTKKWKFRAILNIDGQLKDIKRKGFASKKDAKFAMKNYCYLMKNLLNLKKMNFPTKQ